MIFRLLLLLSLFLILLTTHFIQCEDLEHSKNELFRTEFVNNNESKKYNLVNTSSLSNTWKTTKEAIANNVSKMFSFQILNLDQVISARELMDYVTTGISCVPNLSLQRLTYETVFNSGIQKLERSLNLNSHHLSIGERLIMQSSKQSFSLSKIKNKNDKGNLSRIFVTQHQTNNDLKCALKESITNVEKKIEKARVNEPRKSPMEGELKDIEIIKSKRKIMSGDDVLEKVINDARRLKLTEMRKSNLNSVDLIVPVPPNLDENTSFNSINNLDIPNDHENNSADSQNLFRHLSIPELFEGSNGSVESKKRNRRLPPGAEKELEEFFARQSKNISDDIHSKAIIERRTKLSKVSECNESRSGNPYRPLE
ncbi:uncharacterized protein cubi_01411 [Cryptosporidium ubiquitum]|uniref:Uncharacterized protein n=1 Tax=Cryptosporidium ubiquitum TaxID=857276 RepID=A0A1J4MCX9_9CRYT|nr:uncharacterized protein cubi_01411 [Cryptosporidium ubiquitum]OII72078.1 hypothetical protein cubi_01411 [Cryptosporidium ubiquitum]